jgi:subtilisin family serine protease
MRVSSGTWLTFSIGLGFFGLLLTGCGGGGGSGSPNVAKKQFDEVRDTVYDVYPSLHGDSVSTAVAGRQLSSYALTRTNAGAAARGQYAGQNVVVAVPDEGIDIDHPDLAQNIKRRDNQPVGLNALLLQYPGQEKKFGTANDFTPEETNIHPKNPLGTTDISHGTHVAGIIAAADNGLGTLGVAPRAQILPIKFIAAGRRERRQFAPDYDPDHYSFDKDISTITSLIDFASRENAFVFNASWGTSWRPYVEEVTFDDESRGYFLRPRQTNLGYREFTKKMLREEMLNAILNANAGEEKNMVFVFGAGNDGWNAETGRIDVFREKFSGDDIDKYLNDAKAFTFLPANHKIVAQTETPANLPSPSSSLFLADQRLEGLWLSVVATDRSDKIAPFSNGCGAAKDFCLAAPGVEVVSTATRSEHKSGYARFSGTSMAAPMVSGALAVLKSRHPRLGAKEAVRILLESATDLGNKGVDDVYGHGLLNLNEALKPSGNTNPTGRNALSLSSVAAGRTRMSFSGLFGDAASRRKLSFGAFDKYNRSYSYRTPLSTQALPVPDLADALRLNAPRDGARALSADGRSLMRWSNDAASSMGAGQQVTIAGRDYAATMGFAQRQTASAVMPLGSLSGHDSHYNQTLWPKISRTGANLIRGSLHRKVGEGVEVGVHVTRGELGDANSHSSPYDFSDYGASLSLQKGRAKVGLNGGQFREDGHFLGSRAEGGYELAKGSHSNYLHVNIGLEMGKWSATLGSSYIRSIVDFRHNSFIDDSVVRANETSLALVRHDVGRKSGRIGISYKQPMAVTSGTLSQHSVRGYTDDGHYKVVNDRLDLSVRQRHEMLQLDYQAPLMRDVSWFLSASAHRNWGHFSGRENAMLQTGLSAKF